MQNSLKTKCCVLNQIDLHLPNAITVKPALSGTCYGIIGMTTSQMSGQDLYIHFLNINRCIRPEMAGHLPCQNKFSWIQECPDIAYFTVLINLALFAKTCMYTTLKDTQQFFPANYIDCWKTSFRPCMHAWILRWFQQFWMAVKHKTMHASSASAKHVWSFNENIVQCCHARYCCHDISMLETWKRCA